MPFDELWAVAGGVMSTRFGSSAESYLFCLQSGDDGIVECLVLRFGT